MPVHQLVITFDTVFQGTLKCGNSDTSWAARSYTIEGPICECNAAFQNSSGDTVCRSCALGFDTCACKVSGTAQLRLVDMGDAWYTLTKPTLLLKQGLLLHLHRTSRILLVAA